jgi:hypothetical protein
MIVQGSYGPLDEISGHLRPSSTFMGCRERACRATLICLMNPRQEGQRSIIASPPRPLSAHLFLLFDILPMSINLSASANYIMYYHSPFHPFTPCFRSLFFVFFIYPSTMFFHSYHLKPFSLYIFYNFVTKLLRRNMLY